MASWSKDPLDRRWLHLIVLFQTQREQFSTFLDILLRYLLGIAVQNV